MARPRSPEARQKALDAATAVVGSEGIPGFTIDAVVARSGVAKTTIYRNWPSANDLLIDVIRNVVTEIDPPDTGSLRGDLLEMYNIAVSIMCRPEMSSMMFDLKSRAASDPDLAKMREALEFERMRPLRIVIERARDRGEIGSSVPVEILCDVVGGPVMARTLFRGVATTPKEIEMIVDTLVDGLGSR